MTTTVHRTLGKLLDVGALQRAEGGYSVTFRITLIGSAWLHRAVGLTIPLCALRGADDVYLAKPHGPGSRLFATEVGMSLPAHCTGVGMTLLAYAAQDAVAAVGTGSLRPSRERSVRALPTLRQAAEPARR